jgi:hypothetical protein
MMNSPQTRSQGNRPQTRRDSNPAKDRIANFTPEKDEAVAITLISINVPGNDSAPNYFDTSVLHLLDAEMRTMKDEYDEDSDLRVNASGRVVPDGGLETVAGAMKMQQVIDLLNLQEGACRMYQLGAEDDTTFKPERFTKVISSTENNPPGYGLKRRTVLKAIEPFRDYDVYVNLWINPTEDGKRIVNVVVRPLLRQVQHRVCIEAEVVGKALVLTRFFIEPNN